MSFTYQPILPAGQIHGEPYGSAPSANVEGYVNVWTGSAWAPKPVKVWTGTEWVIKKAKFWNGTIWVPTYNGGWGGPSPPGSPLFWVRGDAGITKGTGDNVTQWSDQSGNGYNLTRADSAACPDAAAADTKNGLQVVDFNAADSEYFNLSSSIPSLLTDYTIGFVAYKTDSELVTLDCGDHFIFGKFSGDYTWYMASGTTTFASASGSGSPGWVVVVARVSGQPGTATVYENGVSLTIGGGGSSPTSTAYDKFGVRNSTNYGTGKFAEFVLYNNTTTDLTELQTYLNNRWAVY